MLQSKGSQRVGHDRATEQLAVQWLGPWASSAGGEGSIPGWGTKTSYTMQYSKKKKKRKRNKKIVSLENSFIEGEN